jgi:hypothetical protein
MPKESKEPKKLKQTKMEKPKDLKPKGDVKGGVGKLRRGISGSIE